MNSTGKEGGTKVAALYIRVSTLDQATIIARKHGGIGETITVRRILQGDA